MPVSRYQTESFPFPQDKAISSCYSSHSSPPALKEIEM